MPDIDWDPDPADVETVVAALARAGADGATVGDTALFTNLNPIAVGKAIDIARSSGRISGRKVARAPGLPGETRFYVVEESRMPSRTKVISVHRVRRAARKRERLAQEALRVRLHYGQLSVAQAETLRDVPSWAMGVRVEKAGLFQWAVVATDTRGR